MKPMWSSRWVYTIFMLNQSLAPKNYLAEEYNSAQTNEVVSKLFLLGDDYILDNHMNFMVHKREQIQITIVL